VPKSTLDVLRHSVGVDDGPGVIDALCRTSDSTIDEIAGPLLASPARPMRPVASNEVRPLVNARASLLSRGAQGFEDGVGPAGVSVMAAMNPREVGSNTSRTAGADLIDTVYERRLPLPSDGTVTLRRQQWFRASTPAT
jgi:hypothetical protein